MFKKYLSKVLSILARQLSKSEESTVKNFFENGFSVNYTAEYLK